MAAGGLRLPSSQRCTARGVTRIARETARREVRPTRPAMRSSGRMFTAPVYIGVLPCV
jgi:hypothetical protein